ncbi:MAG: alpha/beta fold hydrolase [Chthoniobacteraceae bacterium]
MQTLLPALLPRRIDCAFARERLELADGDFVDLDWLRAGHARVAILTHGLEGDTRANYIRGQARALADGGWDVLAWNFRGCSGVPNRLLRYYHAGDTGDLGAVVAHAAARYARIALVGFSLGGNVTLKYLGEAPPHPAVAAGVAIDAAVDLASCVRRLDRERANWLYRRHFLATLLDKIEAKARQFPGQLNLAGLHRIRGIEEYDDRYAAPIHGFRDAADYYARSSARQFLPRIAVPALLLNARDDPFLAPACFPESEAEQSAHLHLEAPAHGGHIGFLDLARGVQPWSERRVLEFLDAAFAPIGERA